MMRVSRHFTPWLDRDRRERRRVEARRAFEADVAAARDTLDIVKFPLLPAASSAQAAAKKAGSHPPAT